MAAEPMALLTAKAVCPGSRSQNVPNGPKGDEFIGLRPVKYVQV